MLCALLLVLASPWAGAGTHEPSVLDPATYRSPRGRYELTVDPSERRGAGPSKCRFARDGTVLWERELEFTPYFADVDDAGVIVAAGYTAGWLDVECEGRTFTALSRADGDDLAIVHSDAREHVRDHDVSGPMWPLVRGVLVDADDGLAIVRRTRRGWAGGEEWLLFSRDARTLQDVVEPPTTQPIAKNDLLALRPLADSALLVGCWGGEFPRLRFGLFDARARLVLELHEAAEDGLDQGDFVPGTLASRGAIVRAPVAPRCFEIVRVRKGERVRYQVCAEDSGSPHVEEVVCEAESVLVDWALAAGPHSRPESRHLGTCRLGIEEEVEDPGSFHSLLGFEFDAHGDVECLARVGRDPDRIDCLTFDESGRFVSARPSGVTWIGSRGRRETCLLPEGRWIVAEAPARSAPIEAYARLDAAGLHEVAPTTKPEASTWSTVRALASQPRGGFLSLVELPGPGSSTVLLVHDASGHVRWKKTASLDVDPKDPASLFAPEHLAVLGDGRIVVVDALRARLQVFEADGTFARALELVDVFGKRPRFADRVFAGGDGTLIVHDGADSDSTITHVTLDGRTLGRIVPHVRATAGLPRRADDLRVAPSGNVWWNAGSHLSVLSADGTQDVRIRSRPQPARFTEPALEKIVVDAAGHLFAFVGSTVQVFERDGRSAGTFELPQDASGFVHPRAEGGLLLRCVPRGWIAFDPSGRELGPLPGNAVYAHDVVSVGAGRVWTLDKIECRLVLVDNEGREHRRIDRRADGAWLRPKARAEPAPGGTICVHDPGEGALMATLDVYDREGAFVRSCRIGEALGREFAFTGRFVATARSAGVVELIDTLDKRTWSIHLGRPGGEASRWSVHAGPGGELWAVEHVSRTLERFALPE